MKATWPPTLRMQFICENKPVSNILININLLSSNKNNYSIGYFLSNIDGSVMITRDMFIDTINKYQTEYPMDYSGNIEDCVGIEIIIRENNDLISIANTLSQFYADKARELQSMIRNSSNMHYKNKHIIYKIPIKPKIIIHIQEFIDS